MRQNLAPPPLDWGRRPFPAGRWEAYSTRFNCQWIVTESPDQRFELWLAGQPIVDQFQEPWQFDSAEAAIRVAEAMEAGQLVAGDPAGQHVMLGPEPQPESDRRH